MDQVGAYLLARECQLGLCRGGGRLSWSRHGAVPEGWRSRRPRTRGVGRHHAGRHHRLSARRSAAGLARDPQAPATSGPAGGCAARRSRSARGRTMWSPASTAGFVADVCCVAASLAGSGAPDSLLAVRGSWRSAGAPAGPRRRRCPGCGGSDARRSRIAGGASPQRQRGVQSRLPDVRLPVGAPRPQLRTPHERGDVPRPSGSDQARASHRDRRAPASPR